MLLNQAWANSLSRGFKMMSQGMFHKAARRALTWIVTFIFILAQLSQSTSAASFYWSGTSAANAVDNATTAALWNSVIGGTNWSTSADIASDPGSAPTNADDVFFVFSPE